MNTEVLFFIVLILFSIYTYRNNSLYRCSQIRSFPKEQLELKLKKISEQVKDLNKQNKRLQRLLQNVEAHEGFGPNEEYENLRRRIFSNTKDLSYYLSHGLKNAASNNLTADQKLTLLQDVAHRKMSLLSDLEKLPGVDGYQEWRRKEAEEVSDLVQRRLQFMQTPPDCQLAKIVICADHNTRKDCSYGCQLHQHLVHALIFSYASARTLVLDADEEETEGWEAVLLPVSETCTNEGLYLFNGVNLDVRIDRLSVPILNSDADSLSFLPLSIPEDLANRIIRFNGDPSSWWVGQMVKFLLKPVESVKEIINFYLQLSNITSPFVGIHVRRTGKVNSFHLDEYMSRVADYYDQLQLTDNVSERRVYVATDDITVHEMCRQKYPQYTFYGDPNIARWAVSYSTVALTGLLVDLHNLAKCDYVVGTFSSLVSRTAYEMLQSSVVDASDKFVSLDEIYFFPEQDKHTRKAVIANKGGVGNMAFNIGDVINIGGNHWNGYGFGTNMRTLQIGEVINIGGNHWNGYGFGTNMRTLQSGLFPWYKTADILVLYPFPKYEEVQLTTEPPRFL